VESIIRNKQRRASHVSITTDERIISRIKNYWNKAIPTPIPNVYKLIVETEEEGVKIVFEI
jgi:hypothetical protein